MMTDTQNAPRHYVIFCSGFHTPELTDRAIAGLDLPSDWIAIAIPSQIWPCDFMGIHHYLQHAIPAEHRAISKSFVAFSAGTVGALGAALLESSPISAIVLCDGWGVPILPLSNRQQALAPIIHRISHDRWTHQTWTSQGVLTASFVAEPDVAHLTLWRDLDRVRGRAFDRHGRSLGKTTARHNIRQSLGLEAATAPANVPDEI